ncbi:riboflavin synthase [Bacillus marinisedimentorum]|uniref:riboflavin synthase n=1 Tax=Bacillus marinisedimentorum TaxID=1821260 RepID=UPI0007E0736A|nr:riboflavin synthase [Bacillus marinisedimentorum]
MFTGIIEEIGTIRSIRGSGEAIAVTVGAEKVLEDVRLGDSIAVNGVCLTVTSFTDNRFTVDVMPETVKATNLRDLTTGSKVNLERAMAAGGRFGGHFVSGHIDGTGKIINKNADQNAVYYEIEADDSLLTYMMMKGSVSVDGTSLTIFGLTEHSFTVSLIPHTRSHTVLGAKEKGDTVNVECDMLSKYVNRILEAKTEKKPSPEKQGISMDFLADNGFM